MPKPLPVTTYTFRDIIENGIYNPFSTIHLFYHGRFFNYWFESGTPTFLIKLIHQRNYDVSQLQNLHLRELASSTYQLESVDAEVKTNQGRIDAVVEFPEHLYIFEFKLDGTAEEALQQI